MKRKILILILLVFMVAGCDIEYHLTIDKDNNYSEDFTITAYQDENNSKEFIYQSYLEEYPIYDDEEFMYYNPYNKNEGYTYYNKTYRDIGNGYVFNYKDNFEYKDFNRIRTLKTAFSSGGNGYIKEKDYYYISASNPKLFKYNANLDNMVIYISLKDLEVIKHNADEVRNNVYVWNFKRNDNKSIELQYKYNKQEEVKPGDKEDPKDDNLDAKKEENTIFDYIILGAIIGLFFIAIIGLIKYKSINKAD